MIMMADKTFGVKVSEEMYEKVREVIESSGISSKDWFEKAVALYEMNSIKQGSSDYTQDLSELEHHTTRIYELIVNMIQRSVHLKESAVKEYADKLYSKESIIVDLQQKLITAKEEYKLINTELNELKEAHVTLQEQVSELRENNDNKQLLIEQYKEKNDTLSGLVTQYRGYAEENMNLKEQLHDLQVSSQKKLAEVYVEVEKLEKSVLAAEGNNEKLQKEHAERLQMVNDKKDLEREKAIVELERTHQAKNAELNDQYNEKIRLLYEELEKLRNSNDVLRRSFEKERQKYVEEIEKLQKGFN